MLKSELRKEKLVEVHAFSFAETISKITVSPTAKSATFALNLAEKYPTIEPDKVIIK